MTRLELERLLWPDGHVPENGLSKSVLDVRRALGHQDHCALIRTVHGFGYAFIGRAREETESPRPPKLGSFRVLINGREIALVQGENWMGRANECRIQVGSSLVSRRHACIVVCGPDVTLTDGPSRNGTFLNRKLLSGPVALRHRDQIQLGSEDVSIQILYADKPTDRVSVARNSAKARRTSIRETGLTLVRATKRVDG